jgi:trans-2,3-dihydro-3-hydroxyanthranilate isomerase
MDLAYHLVDVFTTKPFEGNPLAVFPDATGLDPRTMQSLAFELNLSETTFILPGEGKNGATRVRIFTPRAEMLFAGHPTIGTAYMIRELGLVPAKARELTLDENIGPVRVRVDEGDNPMLWLTTPPMQDLGPVPQAACAAAVSLSESDLVAPCEIVSAGNPTLFVAVRDAETVDRAAVDTAALARLLRAAAKPVLVFVFAPRSTGAYSRMFAPHLGVAEDPATGSATGPLAAFMLKHGLVSRADGTRFVSEQGTAMGRRSFLHVAIRGEGGRDGIEVGGNVRHVAKGAFDVAIHS